MRFLARCGIFCAALLSLPPAARAQETDYLPDSEQWNGLSELVMLARGLRIPMQLTEELDWASLDQKDVLFFVFPRSKVPPKQLIRFVEGGGRVLIADDFGAADDALVALGIQRTQRAPGDVPRHYRGNANLPIARPGAPHQLTRGLREVVTNHPAFFRSRHTSLLTFGNGQQLLVSAELGKGRFVAIADPSIFINSMMRLQGNVILANNLLSGLCPTGQERVLLLTGLFKQRAAPPQPKDGITKTLGTFNSRLDRVNDFALTQIGMRVIGFMVAGLALTALLVFLPTPRKDLDGHWLIARPRDPSDGKVRVSEAAASVAEAADRALSERLGAPGPLVTIDPRWILSRARDEGGAEAESACGALLNTLKQIPYTEQPRSKLTGKKLFRRLIRETNALFAMLGMDGLPGDWKT